jgi:protein involved in polysaccharide export with SLBB domain
MTSMKWRAFCCWIIGLTWCGVAVAQRPPGQLENQSLATTSTVTRQTRPDQDPEETSRVAAPVEQIRAVLVKDPGLLVELEHMVEKEAISKGQLVEDSDLTEQAVFDRLDEDVAFRASATRLVQRWGYLLPHVNPESEMGKQQDLVLKERARQFVQIEAREETEAMQTRKREDEAPELANRENCDSQSITNCGDSVQRHSRGKLTTIPSDPPSATPNVPPFLRQDPQPGGPSVLQTQFFGGGSSIREDGSDGNDSLRIAAMNASRDPSTLQSSPELLQRLLDSAKSGGANFDDGAVRSGSVPERPYDRAAFSLSPSLRSSRVVSRDPKGDSLQGMVVHKASPYSDVPSLVDLYVQVSTRDRVPERFGVNILTSNTRESEALPMDLPVGPDYVVGPGDGLAIDLWGGIFQRLQRTVDAQGRISLPEYGPVLVSGKTLGNVQLTVQQLLRTQLRGVSTDVSLSRLRTVRVYVVGEVADPGAYDVSSLSSPLNALVAAGGLTDRGSLRAIKHYRGKQLIEVVDAYDLLLHGVGSDQQRLENGDSLLVPPVGPQVTIEGMVRRPAIYELRGTTSLEEALELAGGVLPAAALEHVEVERLVAHENRTMLSLNLSAKENAGTAESQLHNFQVQDGDRIHIFPIAPYNERAIYLQGHVLRPGRYSYKDGMTLRDLITSYSDLLPEPAGKYAEIIRLDPPDLRPSVQSFDLAAALSNPERAPKLKALDTVRIFSKFDFQPAPDLWVDGAVRSPGQYTTSGQIHFRDAIYLAGGLTSDAAIDSAQIIRSGQEGMKVLSVNVEEALAGNSSQNLLLLPNDRIVVHHNASKVEPAAVYVQGDVPNPGRYPLSSNMHVQDLLRLAGGLKPSADTQSAVLTHRNGDQLVATEVESLKINLAAVAAGHSDDNRVLSNGDVLTIRQNPGRKDLGASVTLRGEVQHPGTYGIAPDESLSSVLQKAGGFTPHAYPYGIVLTRREVRELEMKSHEQLITRVKAAALQLKNLPENDEDQKNAKLTAIAQTETTLAQLETNLPVGRVVVHGALDHKSFEHAAQETPLRSGDVITVPKKPSYVAVEGQVFNTTAVGFVPGRSAKWYLSQAGGLTQLADKKAVFVIRADGSVLAATNNRSIWSGDPMNAVLMPGDLIVVPERAPKVGSRNLTPLMQSAQAATSVALAVAYLKP